MILYLIGICVGLLVFLAMHCCEKSDEILSHKQTIEELRALIKKYDKDNHSLAKRALECVWLHGTNPSNGKLWTSFTCIDKYYGIWELKDEDGYIIPITNTQLGKLLEKKMKKLDEIKELFQQYKKSESKVEVVDCTYRRPKNPEKYE